MTKESKQLIIEILNQEDLGFGEISFKIQDSKVVFIREQRDERV